MQLMPGVLKKKLKHDVEELDLPQATTASRILKDRRPDVTFYLCAGHPVGCRGPMRRASASWLKDSKRFEKKNTASPGLRIRNGRAPLKKGHRSGRDQCYKFYIFFILGLLRPSSWLRRGFFYLRKSSGTLARFAAMRRAPSPLPIRCSTFAMHRAERGFTTKNQFNNKPQKVRNPVPSHCAD